MDNLTGIAGGLQGSDSHGNQKVRVCYVTSPRELQGEGAGSDARIEPTLSHLHNAIMQNPLLRNVGLEIAAVFVDDDGRERGREIMQRENAAFAFLRGFCERNGIAFHFELSRSWRHLPLSEKAEREAGKREYEEKMLAFMRQNSIDIILSDSYTVLFNSTMLDAKRGYRDLIVNIHPGIADEVPGIFPTRDALNRSRFFTGSASERERVLGQLAADVARLMIARDGCDDSVKNVLGRMGIAHRLEGGEVLIERNGKPIFRAATGATLHLVDEQIDHGPTIFKSSGTPIRDGICEHELRVDNYATKNNTVVRGLRMLFCDGKWSGIRERIAENRIRNTAHNRESIAKMAAPERISRGHLQARGGIQRTI